MQAKWRQEPCCFPYERLVFLPDTPASSRPGSIEIRRDLGTASPRYNAAHLFTTRFGPSTSTSGTCQEMAWTGPSHQSGVRSGQRSLHSQQIAILAPRPITEIGQKLRKLVEEKKSSTRQLLSINPSGWFMGSITRSGHFQSSQRLPAPYEIPWPKPSFPRSAAPTVGVGKEREDDRRPTPNKPRGGKTTAQSGSAPFYLLIDANLPILPPTVRTAAPHGNRMAGRHPCRVDCMSSLPGKPGY